MSKDSHYLFYKIEKPLSHNSRVTGKILTIKDWVKQKTLEKKAPVYTHPIFLSQVYNEEDFIKIYARTREEFIETFKNYKERCDG
jgi:hypothetical protein